MPYFDDVLLPIGGGAVAVDGDVGRVGVRPHSRAAIAFGVDMIELPTALMAPPRDDRLCDRLPLLVLRGVLIPFPRGCGDGVAAERWGGKERGGVRQHGPKRNRDETGSIIPTDEIYVTIRCGERATVCGKKQETRNKQQ